MYVDTYLNLFIYVEYYSFIFQQELLITQFYHITVSVALYIMSRTETGLIL